MDKRQRSELVKIFPDGVLFDRPMDQYTTFRVGGRAEAICPLTELILLRQMVSFLNREKIPCIVVGKGSNLLVRDGGIRGVVIILKGKLAHVEKAGEDHDALLAGGGLALAELLSFCSHNGLAGPEFLAGIPGTVGGAVFMNSGAYGKEIGSLVQEIRTVTGKGDLAVIDRFQLKFSYRKLSVPKGTLIHGVTFKLCKDRADKIKGRIADYLERRRKSQPLDLPSGGSVFRNPTNDYAGRLIEQAGLKGTRIGGALISRKHANFIVNTGGAKAKDILALMDLARKKVRQKTGIELEPEIRVVGQ